VQFRQVREFGIDRNGSSKMTFDDSHTMECRWNWVILAPVTLAAAAIAAPLLLFIPTLSFALQRGFALVCHQQAERSFFVFGGSVAVCARCLGIYLGAAIGLLVRVPRQVAMRFLVAAIALNAADWLTETAGLHGNWIHVRFVLGIISGTAAAMLVAASSTRELPAPATSHRSGLVRHERF
jgi:uncharacterized membrane protein